MNPEFGGVYIYMCVIGLLGINWQTVALNSCSTAPRQIPLSRRLSYVERELEKVLSGRKIDDMEGGNRWVAPLFTTPDLRVHYLPSQ